MQEGRQESLTRQILDDMIATTAHGMEEELTLYAAV